jgi:hypothetical protein
LAALLLKADDAGQLDSIPLVDFKPQPWPWG